MTLLSRLDRAITYWSFGWLPSDKLPEVAIEALEEGSESPTLIQLASSRNGADPDLNVLFERAIKELGRTRLSKSEAGRIIAKDLAHQICTGKITPIEGARMIWRVVLECEELTEELGIFAGRASEYEDLPSLRERISEMIVSEAEALIAEPK